MINTTLPFPEQEQKRETTLMYPQSTPETPPSQQSNLQPPPMAQQTIPITNPPVANKLTQSMQQTIANQEPPQQAPPQSEPATAQEKKTRQKKEPTTDDSKKEEKKAITIYDKLDEAKSEIAKLGTIKDLDRFMRVNTTWLKLSPKVQQCNPRTILGAILTAAEWGLEPNTISGECCIVARNNTVQMADGTEKKEWQAVFQMQPQGWQTLAEKLPDVERIDTFEVYEGDPYKVTLGLTPTLLHERAPIKERGKVILYYAYILMKNGYFKLAEISHDMMVAKVKAKPGVYQSSAWKNPELPEFHEKAKWHVVGIVTKLMKGKIRKFAQLNNQVRFYDPNEPSEMSDIDMNNYDDYEDADYTVEMDDTELLDIPNEAS